MGSPASRRATNLTLSSMTEHSFHGIHFLPERGASVTYVSGTICYLCLGSLTQAAHWISENAILWDSTIWVRLGQVSKSSTCWTATFRSHWQTVQLLKVV